MCTGKPFNSHLKGVTRSGSVREFRRDSSFRGVTPHHGRGRTTQGKRKRRKRKRRIESSSRPVDVGMWERIVVRRFGDTFPRRTPFLSCSS